MNKQKNKKMKKVEKTLTGLSGSALYDLRIENNYIPVLGEGSLDSSIVFIGEAPGKKEAQTGIPFCGASGKILDHLLSHISLNRETVYITNIVKDRPPENRDPNKKEIALYTPLLIEQINIIQPRVVVTLGRHAMELMFKEYGLTDVLLPIGEGRAKPHIIEQEWGSMTIIPLYHPAVAVYNRKQLPILEKDFELLKQYI